MLHWFHCSAKQKTSFVSRATKDASRKREVFSHTLFLENEEQTIEKKYMVMLFN